MMALLAQHSTGRAHHTRANVMDTRAHTAQPTNELEWVSQIIAHVLIQLPARVCWCAMHVAGAASVPGTKLSSTSTWLRLAAQSAFSATAHFTT